MPLVRVNDCNFYYEQSGSGPDLVFIHGESHGIEMFEHQVAHFSDNYRCTTYYRRGHGRSELTPYGYSLRNQMLDLSALLDQLGIQHSVLAAVAMATTIAATYALEYPERVQGLVFASWYELDGFPLMERRRQQHNMSFAEQHMQMFKLVRAGGQQALSDYMKKEGDNFLPILPFDPECRDQVIRMMSSHPAEHYVKSAEFYTSMPNLVPRMKEITCPILGICGENDPSPDMPDLLQAAGHFQQAWVPRARRFSLMEAPMAFNSALTQFLQCLHHAVR